MQAAAGETFGKPLVVRKCRERSTHDEWSLIEPLIPPAKRGGRRRE
jgi:hypothetical protein